MGVILLTIETEAQLFLEISTELNEEQPVDTSLLPKPPINIFELDERMKRKASECGYFIPPWEGRRDWVIR
jgi:hypothetical protein